MLDKNDANTLVTKIETIKDEILEILEAEVFNYPYQEHTHESFIDTNKLSNFNPTEIKNNFDEKVNKFRELMKLRFPFDVCKDYYINQICDNINYTVNQYDKLNDLAQEAGKLIYNNTSAFLTEDITQNELLDFFDSARGTNTMNIIGKAVEYHTALVTTLNNYKIKIIDWSKSGYKNDDEIHLHKSSIYKYGKANRLVIDIENHEIYSAFLQALEDKIIIYNEKEQKFDFQIDVGASYLFFKTGNYTEWAIIKEHCLIKGSPIAKDFRSSSGSKQATMIIKKYFNR